MISHDTDIWFVVYCVVSLTVGLGAAYFDGNPYYGMLMTLIWPLQLIVWCVSLPFMVVSNWGKK